MQIKELPVHHKLVTKLSEKGFTHLTEIQEKTILPALQGKDIIASSKTGSGKTLAFLIPAIHRLISTKALSKKDPRVLILAPTRELAKQVFLEAKWLCSKQSLLCQLIVGGENYNDQVKFLKRNPHIIVGTAGRVADHLRDKSLYLNGLELLIFDEADRMMDLGFAPQLAQINDFADHRKRQTMLFSATLDSIELAHMKNKLLNAPVRVAVGSGGDQHVDITQTLFFADNVSQKEELLVNQLNSVEYDQAIVFTATREDTQRLTDILNVKNKDAIALSGDLPQNQRANIMSSFGRGQHSVLVTTDVASRGLDLSKVGLVVNFDMPKQADEYIHRIGRTGRAGQQGSAVSFVGPRDWKSYLAVKTTVSYPLPCIQHPEIKAKFEGFKSTAAKRINKSSDKPASSVKNTSSVKRSGKRVNTMSGEDIGIRPVKRKPKTVISDDDE